jgi:peptidoglycan/xylan/chitin deacetylase (PgdA/CDA1 family)
MSFLIQIPLTYHAERCYILSVLLGDFLGVDFKIKAENRQGTQITAADGRELVITDGLFALPEEQWLTKQSLPRQPLKIWKIPTILDAKIVRPTIPVIYGREPECAGFFTLSEKRVEIGLDIFGSSFFMLTRYEEMVNLERDYHNRFPSSASLALQGDFLKRPIVNEYLEIFWACLKWLWPGVKRRNREYRILPSHDVDEPFRYAFRNLKGIIRIMGGDVLKRRDPMGVLKTLQGWLRVKREGPLVDSFNTFDRIMDLDENFGLNSTFYFMTDHTNQHLDSVYDIDNSLIRSLLRNIHHRGHEIGLHPSYHTYRSPSQTKRELDILKNVCAEERIKQQIWGGRQHFLRWETPITFQNLEDAGLSYDSTLCYADHIGFRCGICYDFTVFNLKSRQTLRLQERPLIVMDRTLLADFYMDLTHEQAWHEISQLKERCKMFDGNFTILWHNDNFIKKDDVELYKSIVKNS